MVRFLLSNTKLKVRIASSLSSEFVTNNGTFEGDFLSGVLFTLVLASALNHVRAVLETPYPPIAFNGMPTETSYADDVDFIHEKSQVLQNNIPQIKKILEEWDLFINDDKTELVTVYLADKAEKMTKDSRYLETKNGVKQMLLDHYFALRRTLSKEYHLEKERLRNTRKYGQKRSSI